MQHELWEAGFIKRTMSSIMMTDVLPAVLELGVMLWTSVYSNAVITGFRAAFKGVGGHAAADGPCGACWVGLEEDTCPALGLGSPSAAADNTTMQLTASLFTCGRHIASSSHASSTLLAPFGGSATRMLLGTLRMALPATSWAFLNCSLAVSQKGRACIMPPSWGLHGGPH